jgi:hypothetical protein
LILNAGSIKRLKHEIFQIIFEFFCVLNFDFQTKEINSYREKIAYEIIAGNLFEQKLCADF